MLKRMHVAVLMLAMFALATGCTTELTPNVPQAVVAPSPTVGGVPQFKVEGAVQSVSLSARVIFLSQPVAGVETIAVTDGTQIADRQGSPLALQQLQSGQSIQAMGEKRGGSLLATRIIVGENPDTSSGGAEAPETKLSTEWKEYASGTLRISFRYPANWQVSEGGGVVYVYSDKLAETGARYYIYLEEYPSPQMQPLKQVIEQRWGSGIAQNIELKETVVDGKTIYETSDIPSADGALTLFIKGDGRYIAASLTPFDRETQTSVQRECEQVLRDLAGSITLEK